MLKEWTAKEHSKIVVISVQTEEITAPCIVNMRAKTEQSDWKVTNRALLFIL